MSNAYQSEKDFIKTLNDLYYFYNESVIIVLFVNIYYVLFL